MCGKQPVWVSCGVPEGAIAGAGKAGAGVVGTGGEGQALAAISHHAAAAANTALKKTS